MTDRENGLDPAQLGLGDMDVAAFRRWGRRTAEMAADFLDRLPGLPVLPDLEPGAVRRRLPVSPPQEAEPLERILADYRELVEPNLTQWQHPGFLAYFSASASGPGILGEWLAAVLNSNVMLWRNAPASTELEEAMVSWLRQLLGLPAGFDGMLTDTASISSLLAVVAARHAVPGLDSREQGLAGRSGPGRLRLYCSAEAHSSIEKAAIVAGVGRQGVRRIPVDAEYRMIPEALAEAIRQDRDQGWLPFAIVATLGTTSTTSLDPAAPVARIAAAEGLWLHVDAAYGGAAAVVPELRGLLAGWEEADSIVVNPHKWLFTPFDASLLLFRQPGAFRDAFSLVPEYLRTPPAEGAHDFHEYGIQLGRRFRALKLWFLIRYFGARGLAARLREHCRLAREFAAWIDADPDWERLAPVPLAVVCYRHRPASLAGREEDPATARELDARNEEILDRVNRSGRVFLSHTRLRGRLALRLAVGNLRTGPEHVREAWEQLRRAASRGSV